MKTTNKTLIEQLKISRNEIERRKEYLGFTQEDVENLASLRVLVSRHIEVIVEEFYSKILSFDEMDRIIGDAETLKRLKNYQKNYILRLFSGHYDEDYVHSRLRVGVVHNRIGLSPKFYIAAIQHLSTIIREMVSTKQPEECSGCLSRLTSVEKIIMFDLSLTFDTYIHGLMEETRRSQEELVYYTESLEEIIAERTSELKAQARIDGLTGLLNQHSFYEELRKQLSQGERRNHPTVLIYFDLDGFKRLNDTQGHTRGDEILIAVAQSVNQSLRKNEISARYGGDEFCIIIPEGTIKEAQQLCERLIVSIEKAVNDTGVTCSMGIAVASNEHHLDPNLLVKKADEAMYMAKKEPGFSVRVAE